MRGKLVLAAILMISAAAAVCDVTLASLEMGADLTCSDRIPIQNAELYSYENFYICGKLNYGQAAMRSGFVSAEAPGMLPKQVAEIRGAGNFYLQGKADTNRHTVFYLQMNVTEPCEAQLAPVAIEVKNACIQLPPSTVQAVPNRINEGGMFTLEISNSPKDMDVVITGLGEPIRSRVQKGLAWAQSFPSYSCCSIGAEGQCSCALQFTFTDTKHPICSNSETRIEVRVHKPQQQAPEAVQDMSLGAIVILAVVIIGTAVAVLMQ